MQLAKGITKFKTATIAESEMVANCGGADVLLAYQPVGPNVGRLVELTQRFSSTRFSTIVDDLDALNSLSAAFAGAKAPLDVFLDIDCGMHRTGVAPGEEAIELYTRISRAPGLRAAGLHAYDGHIHDQDLAARTRRCEADFGPVLELRNRLTKAGLPVPGIVAGGTPTFPIYARSSDVQCSPGTCVFWDAGYAKKLPDLDFLLAAIVLMRVVSKPGIERICVDLGHKAIASENPAPRVELLDFPEARAVTHSEEHLVLETKRAAKLAVGDCLYGVPWHICPTVALHSEVVAVKNGRAGSRWPVIARQRTLTI
jgi:D-serine deaminase-like pyridoxal phosphate-dependent protein